MTIRVLLVDDDHMLLEGLRARLSVESDIQVVGEASDGRTALSLVRTLSPTVVVMDIGMPGMNGVEATRRIRSENDQVSVLALSIHADPQLVHEMLDAGAVGYVLKLSDHEELLRGIRAVSIGQSFLSSQIARLVVRRATLGNRGQTPSSAYSMLGSREREVLQLIAEGKSSAEVAKAMHVSTRTIEAHRHNISKKLGIHGTAELTKYAVREGLTSLED